MLTKLILVAAVLIVAIAAIKTAGGVTIRDSFYFEQHGRDDLREWRTVFLKGAQYVKTDINFQDNATLCASMRRTFSNDPADYPNGCFLLSHYVNGDQLDYNTTDDIAAFFNDTANRNIVLAKPRVLQLCLKNHQPCDRPNGKKWTALMDAFYNTTNPVLKSLGGGVRFVFDSIGPGGDNCRENLWPDWDITWTGGPMSAAESSTGNAWNRRFQMVNMAWNSPNFVDLLRNGYYKFVNASYAIVGWEPSGEVELGMFFQKFIEYEEPHAPGVISAYNADPSMWHVFTSPMTGRFSHNSFGLQYSVTPVTASDDSGLQLTSSLFQYPGSPLQVALHRRGTNGNFALTSALNVASTANFNVTALGGGLTSASLSKQGSDLMLYVFGRSGCIAMLAVRDSSGGAAVSPISVDCGTRYFVVDQLAPLSDHLELKDIAVRISVSASQSTFVAVASLDNTELLGTGKVFMLTFTANGQYPSGNATSFTIVNKPFLVGQLPILTKFEDAPTVDFLPESTSANRYRAVVGWSGDRKVFAATVRGSSASQVSIRPSPSTPIQMGVGAAPTVSLLKDGTATGTPYLLMSYGNSYCFNSELADDSMWIMTGHMVCNMNRDPKAYEVVPEPVNAYVFGTVDNLEATIADERQHAPLGYANSCSETLFHGVFDLGFHPNVELQRRNSGDSSIADGGFLGVAVMSSLLTQSLSTCGNPEPQQGRAIIDSFPLFGVYNP